MPKVPAHAHQASPQSKQNSEDNDEHHLLGAKEEQTREGSPTLITKEDVAGVAQHHGQEAAQQSLESSLEQERAPDEPVGGTHQTHDRDLAGALQNGEPDSDPDDHDGHRGEGKADHQTNETSDVAQIIQLLYPFPAVPHVV